MTTAPMKPRLPLAPLGAALALAWGLPIGLLQAAPATSDEVNGANTPVSESPSPLNAGISGVPAISVVPQSKTVELLLQLQDQPNQLANDGAKAGTDPLRKSLIGGKRAEAAAEQTNPLADLKATILGGATPKAAEGSSRESSPADSPAVRQLAADPQSPTDSAAREPRASILSNPVVRFIRENRTLAVTVSLAVLAAIWLTASFSMRRGR